MNGHIVLHIALFIVTFHVDHQIYLDEDPEKPKDNGGGLYKKPEELAVFFYVRWGHLATALAMLLS